MQVLHLLNCSYVILATQKNSVVERKIHNLIFKNQIFKKLLILCVSKYYIEHFNWKKAAAVL